MPICLKRKSFNTCIVPALADGSETWIPTVRIVNKSAVTQRNMERIMMGITLKDKNRNTWIREQTTVNYIMEII